MSNPSLPLPPGTNVMPPAGRPPAGPVPAGAPHSGTPLYPAPEFGRFIDGHVERTREQLRAVSVISELLVLAGAVLGFLLLFVLADHWVFSGGFGLVGRTLAFLVLIVGVVAFLWIRVLPWWLRRVNPLYAAQTLEQSQPGLKNGLINFLLLRRQHVPMPVGVFHAIEQRAAADLSQVPVDGAVDRSHLFRVAYVLVGLLAVLCIYKVVSPKDPLASAGRVMFPWVDWDAPTRVTISKVEPGDAKIYVGDWVTVSAAINGLSADEPVTLVFSTRDGTVLEQTIPMNRPADSYRYKAVLPNDTNGLGQDGEYYLRAGDVKTKPFHIQVQPAPAIVVERVEYVFPAYTGLSPRSEPIGEIEALEGTTIKLIASANQDVKKNSALVDFNGDNAPPFVKLQGTDRTVSGKFTLNLADKHTHYLLRFETTDGNRNPYPVRHRITVLPDQLPTVEFTSPAKELTLPVNSTAVLKLAGEDPDFALARVTLKFQVGELELPTSDGHQLLKEPKAGPWNGEFTLQPDKLNLKPGDELVYWAEAADNKSPEPHVVTSQRWTIKILEPTAKNPQDQLADANNPRQQRQQNERDPQPNNPPKQGEQQGPPQPNQPQNGQPPEAGRDQPQQGRPDQGKPGQPQQGDGQPGGGENGKPQQGANDAGAQGQPNGPSQPGEQNRNPAQQAPPDGQGNNQNQPRENRPGTENQAGADNQPGNPADGQQPSGQENRPPQKPAAPGEQIEEVLKHFNDDPKQAKPGNEPQQPGENQPRGAKQPGEQQPGENQPGENQPGAQQPEESMPKGEQDPNGQQQPGERKPGGQNQPGDQQQPGAEQDPNGQKQPGEQSKPGGGQSGGQEQAPKNNPQNGGEKGENKQPGGQQKPGGQEQPTSQHDTGKKPNPDQPKPDKNGGGQAGNDSKGQQPGGQKSQGTKNKGEAGQGDTSNGPKQPDGQTGATGEQQPGGQQEANGQTKPKGPGDPLSKNEQKGQQPPKGQGQSGSQGASNNEPAAGESKPAGANEKGPNDAADTKQQPSGQAGQPQQKRPGGEENPEAQNPAREQPKDPMGKGAHTQPGTDDQQQPMEKGDNPMAEGGDANDTKGNGGAGTPDKNSKGSPSAKEGKTDAENQVKDRQKKPDDNPQKANDEKGEKANSPAVNKHESDSKGGEKGDQAGGGGEGGGQKANREGTGGAGSNTASQEGAQKAPGEGQGEAGTKGGAGQKAEKPTGKPGSEEPGNGTNSREGQGTKPGKVPQGAEQTSDDGSPDEGNLPKANPGDKPLPGEESDQAKPTDEASNQPAANQQQKPGPANKGQDPRQGGKRNGQQGPEGQEPGTGGAPSESANAPPKGGPRGRDADGSNSPGGDEANLEYARKATDLALRRLKDELAKDEPDQQLMDRLGWTKEDMQKFVQQWDKLQGEAKQQGAIGADARKRLDDRLKGLGLSPRSRQIDRSTSKVQSAAPIREDVRLAPPPEYAEQTEAYTRGLSKMSRDNPK